MRRRRLLGLAVGSVVGAGTIGIAGAYGDARPARQSATAAAARARGGSNYNFYRLDGCNREPYGVVNSFDKGAAEIRAQLAAMKSAGQQRLRIGIFHRRGPDSGTVMDSTGGNLSASNRAKLADLLAAVKAAGFGEIQVAFHPVAANDPTSWPAWNEDLYQENWNLVHNLRPIIAAAGILYRIDLLNEGVPAPNQPVLLKYSRRLWTDYNHVHGKADTLGVSCIGELARVQRIPEVYGGNPPHLFDFHFYGDEYQRFTTAHQAMNQMGYTSQGWIIGETYYNDDAAADGLARAITDTGRTVFYLCQWPLTRQRRCEHVDVTPPTDFDRYLTHGF